MFDLVLSYAMSVDPTAIFTRDGYGNTLFHMCVIHNLQDMYRHIKAQAEAIVLKELKVVCQRCKLSGETPVIQPLPKAEGYAPAESAIIIPARVAEMHEWLKTEAKRKVTERLSLVLNEDLHSPLTLVAAMGNVEMLECLLDEIKEERWRYGPVSVSLVDLEGLEIPHSRHRYETVDKKGARVSLPRHRKLHSAIEWLCMNNKVEAFAIPLIREIVVRKWERTAMVSHFLSGIQGFTITLLVTFTMFFANSTPKIPRPVGGEIAADIIFPITALYLFFYALYELPFMVKYRLDYWGFFGGVRGAAQYERIFRTLTWLFYCFWAFRRTHDYFGYQKEYYVHQQKEHFHQQLDWSVSVSLAGCVLSSWMYLYYVLMGFDSTGPFVLTVYKIVTHDVPSFFRYYMVVIASFGCAFAVLTDSGNTDANYGFGHFVEIIWGLIRVTVNNSSKAPVSTHDASPRTKPLLDILMTVYFFISSLLMINILIALIGASYGNYSANILNIQLMEKYNIMCGMLLYCGASDHRRLLELYAIPEPMGETDSNAESLPLRRITLRPSIRKSMLYTPDAATSLYSTVTDQVPGPLLLVEEDKLLQESDSYCDGDDAEASALEALANSAVTSYAMNTLKHRFVYWFQLMTMQNTQSQRDATPGFRWSFKWEINDPEWFGRDSGIRLVYIFCFRCCVSFINLLCAVFKGMMTRSSAFCSSLIRKMISMPEEHWRSKAPMRMLFELQI